jgi:hypothetical protein
MLTNAIGSLRASGRAQLAKCDSWVDKGRVNFIRSGLVWCGIDLAVKPKKWQECLILLRPRCSDLFCAVEEHPTYYLALGGWGNVLQSLAGFHCKRLRLLRNRLRLR